MIHHRNFCLLWSWQSPNSSFEYSLLNVDTSVYTLSIITIELIAAQTVVTRRVAHIVALLMRSVPFPVYKD